MGVLGVGFVGIVVLGFRCLFWGFCWLGLRVGFSSLACGFGVLVAGFGGFGLWACGNGCL